MIYISELLRRLYARMKSMEKESGTNLYVVADEAQSLMSGEEDDVVIRKLMEEGRKFGVGVIIATHLSSRLPKSMVGNASTFVSFYQREPSELMYTSKIFGSGDDQKTRQAMRMLSQLRKHQGILISNSVRSPTVFKSQPICLEEKGLLRRRLIGRVHALLGFLKSPHDKGHPKEVRNAAPIRPPTIKITGNKSEEHESAVLRISSGLEAAGIPNKVVNNSNGPDLIAHVEGERIAIEYETGKKVLSETEGMVLRRSKEFSSVIVIVNDASYVRYCSAEGLKIRGVKVINASEMDKLPTILRQRSRSYDEKPGYRNGSKDAALSSDGLPGDNQVQPDSHNTHTGPGNIH